jgi:hypothetical protein
MNEETSIKTAALVAGLGLPVMVVTSPIAELYVFPKLIVPGDPAVVQFFDIKSTSDSK